MASSPGRPPAAEADSSPGKNCMGPLRRRATATRIGRPQRPIWRWYAKELTKGKQQMERGRSLGAGAQRSSANDGVSRRKGLGMRVAPPAWRAPRRAARNEKRRRKDRRRRSRNPGRRFSRLPRRRTLATRASSTQPAVEKLRTRPSQSSSAAVSKVKGASRDQGKRQALPEPCGTGRSHSADHSTPI